MASSKLYDETSSIDASSYDDALPFDDEYDDADVPIIASAPPEELVKTTTTPQTIVHQVDCENNINENSNDANSNSLIVAPQHQDSYYHRLLSDDDDDEDDREMASTLVSIVLGSWWLGPLGGVLAGAGTAYVVQQPDTLMGDICRAMGDVALLAGIKAMEINHKHQVVERSRQSLQRVWRYALDLNRRHLIVTKAKRMIIAGWKETLDYIQRHQLVEKSMETAEKGVEWLLTQIEVVAAAAAAANDK
eukprot:CAMPEP_0178926158 /NCGR_PEP_ID=MMETSP0786-20121207/18353_1 /TAXON_ID=186022 /ORGANISM="Thalassionema frauenfeldii, Strain CCMP 1798" /LENGTH=247 /DNA_ID=CAMNT_0020601201 /DNA_START=32 /DNA_END=775 /DNA_ORIENTATION=+